MTRTYDADGFRRVPPSDRSPGITELRLLDGRCIAAVGVGKKVERVILRRAGR